MKKPMIGIFASLRGGDDPDATALNLAYSEAILAAGGNALIVPRTDEPEELKAVLSLCGGVMLSGGVDVEPRRYGEEAHPALGGTDAVRDSAELRALAILERERKPVFGICRGIQLMNVYSGGTLWQDIPSQRGIAPEVHTQREHRSVVTHPVETAEGSLMRALFGERITVNSHHHQAVKTPGAHWRVTASAPDGIVEAMEHENGLWYAVQWHPEELYTAYPAMITLFRRLVSLSGGE